jgi:hypothetical protein
VLQDDRDGSVDRLMEGLADGSFVVVGLRFPMSRRGRIRFARRVCEDLQLPFEAVRGAAAVEPWSYRAVLAHFQAWRSDVDVAGSEGGR